MSFFSSKFHVCKVLSVNTFLRISFFFHYVSFESFELSSFENVIELEWDVIFAIFAVLMAVVVYT